MAKVSQELAGKQFGWLTAKFPLPVRDLSGNVCWQCVCKCGMVCSVPGTWLRRGRQRSCGCLRRVRRRQMQRRSQQAGNQTMKVRKLLRELGL